VDRPAGGEWPVVSVDHHDGEASVSWKPASAVLNAASRNEWSSDAANPA
jgi:hypothetical protein